MIRAFILLVVFSIQLFQNVAAQGCVAIRGLGAFSCATHHEEVQDPKGWTLTMSNRYFKYTNILLVRLSRKKGLKMVQKSSTTHSALICFYNDISISDGAWASTFPSFQMPDHLCMSMQAMLLDQPPEKARIHSELEMHVLHCIIG